MLPWVFNLYIDGEVNARVLGRGLKLVDGNDNEWVLNQLLFADGGLTGQLSSNCGRGSEKQQ